MLTGAAEGMVVSSPLGSKHTTASIFLAALCVGAATSSLGATADSPHAHTNDPRLAHEGIGARSIPAMPEPVFVPGFDRAQLAPFGAETFHLRVAYRNNPYAHTLLTLATEQGLTVECRLMQSVVRADGNLDLVEPLANDSFPQDETPKTLWVFRLISSDGRLQSMTTFRIDQRTHIADELYEPQIAAVLSWWLRDLVPIRIQEIGGEDELLLHRKESSVAYDRILSVAADRMPLSFHAGECDYTFVINLSGELRPVLTLDANQTESVILRGLADGTTPYAPVNINIPEHGTLIRVSRWDSPPEAHQLLRHLVERGFKVNLQRQQGAVDRFVFSFEQNDKNENDFQVSITADANKPDLQGLPKSWLSDLREAIEIQFPQLRCAHGPGLLQMRDTE